MSESPCGVENAILGLKRPGFNSSISHGGLQQLGVSMVNHFQSMSYYIGSDLTAPNHDMVVSINLCACPLLPNHRQKAASELGWRVLISTWQLPDLSLERMGHGIREAACFYLHCAGY